jgi:hypothetical protein
MQYKHTKTGRAKLSLSELSGVEVSALIGVLSIYERVGRLPGAGPKARAGSLPFALAVFGAEPADCVEPSDTVSMPRSRLGAKPSNRLSDDLGHYTKRQNSYANEPRAIARVVSGEAPTRFNERIGLSAQP